MSSILLRRLTDVGDSVYVGESVGEVVGSEVLTVGVAVGEWVRAAWVGLVVGEVDGEKVDGALVGIPVGILTVGS